MSAYLTCNFPGCGAVVQEFAWITSCSHVFCNEHGQLEFSSRRRESRCPLCSTELPGQLDVVKTEISPSEQYKSMILAGQKPEVVVEIASRALALWHYQTQLVFSREKQERLAADKKTQEMVAKLAQEKAALEMDLKNAEREIDELQKKNSDLENILAEKTRQNLKLSAAYDALRCRLTEQDASRQMLTNSRCAQEHPLDHNQRTLPLQNKGTARSDYFPSEANPNTPPVQFRGTIAANRNMLHSRQHMGPLQTAEHNEHSHFPFLLGNTNTEQHQNRIRLPMAQRASTRSIPSDPSGMPRFNLNF
ncbi:E3 ubiquitin-protein ligase CCNB1IP1-like isoform X2 [Paramacrobiotus metropolitanus]|uniref:E3 ubiquitin-protein ligase CCNB1IP1-like isoform X2 n=1 Tax=Paramacrobiotus metropolitanus TaxID=2943436 RepID=UPI002445ED0D|nr:E3 ubiquitin-protein ligase CCNB1IP1-like isoform X2 [Paramacrobiotus metropolitanus]